MDVDNLSSIKIKFKDEYNLYDGEELDEIMQINDEKSRISKKENKNIVGTLNYMSPELFTDKYPQTIGLLVYWFLIYIVILYHSKEKLRKKWEAIL